MRNLDCWRGMHTEVITRRAMLPAWARLILQADEWWPWFELRRQCWNCDLDLPYVGSLDRIT